MFARSSNLRNLDKDIQFLNWFLDKEFPNLNKEVVFFNSFPHIYLDRETKIG